ncbi:MAG TPA: response regulator [Candidatus Cloacimonetes bacterium]|nr:response regulator [Candidatus Cloacimonadota bacterium]
MEKRILVVDDEIEVTEYLKLELEECSRDWRVICKNSGYEALREIMEGNIDLLLTDIAMPDMDGYELYARIKELNEKIPIIMMTGFGYDPNHAVVKSRKAGLQDVIFKPFDIKKLFEMIKKRMQE